MERDEYENGFTLDELLRIAKKRALYLLGIAALVCMIAVMLCIFWYNPAHKTYNYSFTISYPAAEGFQKYPDGTPFYYRDMVSASYLNEAKSSDIKFSEIDVDAITTRDDIAILQETANSQSTGAFTVSVKGSYFINDELANDFLRAVAAVPVTRMIRTASETDYRLDAALFESASFSEKITLLKEQKDALLSQYDSWISDYRENYVTAGRTLKNHRADISVLYSESVEAAYKAELESCGYVQTDKLFAQKTALVEEKALNNKKITALKSTLKDSEPISRSDSAVLSNETASQDTQATIARLILRNEQIDFQLEKLTEANVLDFAIRLNNEYLKLNAAAETATRVSADIYTQQSAVTFSTANAAVTGEWSILLVSLASAFVALVITYLCFVLAEKRAGAKAEERENTATKSEGEALLNPVKAAPLYPSVAVRAINELYGPMQLSAEKKTEKIGPDIKNA